MLRYFVVKSCSIESFSFRFENPPSLLIVLIFSSILSKISIKFELTPVRFSLLVLFLLLCILTWILLLHGPENALMLTSFSSNRSAHFLWVNRLSYFFPLFFNSFFIRFYLRICIYYSEVLALILFTNYFNNYFYNLLRIVKIEPNFVKVCIFSLRHRLKLEILVLTEFDCFEFWKNKVELLITILIILIVHRVRLLLFSVLFQYRASIFPWGNFGSFSVIIMLVLFIFFFSVPLRRNLLKFHLINLFLIHVK